MFLYEFLKMHAEKQQNCCTVFCLGFHAEGQQLIVRIVLKTVPKKLQTTPRNLCQTAIWPPWNTCPSCCIVFLETRAQTALNCVPLLAVRICWSAALVCVPWFCSPSPHCSEISFALFFSFSQSAHERMNDLLLGKILRGGVNQYLQHIQNFYFFML